MLQCAHGGGGDDWQTATLQNLKRSSGFWVLGRMVQKGFSHHILISLARSETNMTETPGARAGFLQVPPTSPFFSHTAHALLLAPPPPARAPQIWCRLSWPPPDGCQSQLSAVPWLPKQRSLGALATPPLDLLPAFRALRPITRVRVFFGSRLPAPALLKTHPFSEVRRSHLTRGRSLGGKQEGACA